MWFYDVTWHDVTWRDVTWLDETLLLQLHDIEYYAVFWMTTHHLLYRSISANTLTGGLQTLVRRQSRRANWGSEIASRQRRRHWSHRQRKLHHHVTILRIVHNWIRHCVNFALQWSRHYCSNNNRSGRSSNSDSSSSSDDEYSITLLLISQIQRPVVKCRQYDDDIAQ